MCEQDVKLSRKYGVSLWLVILVTGCVSLPNVSIQEIEGRSVELVSAGQGAPTVVFETGLGPTMNTWHSIFQDVAAFTKVFAYNRPGYGRSTPSFSITSSGDIVEMLRNALTQTGHEPPYVLVGHSAGGLFANAFARMYPQEIAGVVFIDATHPEWSNYLKAEHALLYSSLIASTTVGRLGTRRYESKIIRDSKSEFDRLPAFPDIPIVVLTSEKSTLFESRQIRERWVNLQRDLAALSTKSTHIIVEGSNHYIHKTKPQVVIKAIRQVVEGSKP